MARLKTPDTLRAKGLRLALLPLVLLAVFLLNVSLGSVSIPLSTLLHDLFLPHPSTFNDILWQFRLPKALTCVLGGASLATGGLLMQTLFRNPLAGPDVLGLSAGASLTVAIMLLTGASGAMLLPVHSPWSLAVAASLGSFAVFVAIMAFANRMRDNASLLIIGLMIAAASSSVVSVLQYMSQADELQLFLIWTLGNVGGTNWQELGIMLLVLLLGMGISFASLKSINAWLLGDNYAQSLGVNLKRSRLAVVFATSVMTGAVTAFCGPIAFVGLAVPHLVRLAWPTTDHRLLLPMVVFGGAILLLACDILAQLPGSARVLPLNAVTSMVGAPIVIWLVLRQRRINV